jgi:uncharacterized protein (DUF362 family)
LQPEHRRAGTADSRTPWRRRSGALDLQFPPQGALRDHSGGRDGDTVGVAMIEVQPYIRERPGAVFVLRTHLTALADTEGMAAAGRLAAAVLFRPAVGATPKRRIVIKPNITAGLEINPATGLPHPGQDGVVTHPAFVGGLADGLRQFTAVPMAVAEGTPLTVVDARVYTAMLRERGMEYINLDEPKITATEFPETGLNWYPVNGVVHRDLPFVRPVGDPDVFLINLPKMKAHNLAVTTLAVKNMQGAVPLLWTRQFCQGVAALDAMPPRVRALFQPDAPERIEALFRQHLAAGYASWDAGGIRDESYVQRAVDLLAGPQPDLHLIEGCTIRDGTGFRRGRDSLGNYVIAGRNAVAVDAIATWIMGHDPRNVGLYRVANERGRGENDPARIEVFLATDNGITPIDYRDLERVPAGVYRFGDNSVLRFF